MSKLNLKQETAKFQSLASAEKLKNIKIWVKNLAQHYEYFRDMETYISDHKDELDNEFLDALFQIILNLAKEIERK